MPGRRLLAASAATITMLATGASVNAYAAASVTSATFSGGVGTFPASNGTVYAKQGAAMTLTVAADSNTKCVRVTSGTSTIDQVGSVSFTFSSGLPIFTAGSGNGLVPVSVAGYANANPQGKCTANQGENFTAQPSYTLDNTAPTASAALSPAPNGVGWNRSDVTLAWSGSDTGGSGVKSVAPASDSVTTDGKTTKTAIVTDNVGNTATASTIVQLDKTAPTITGSRTPAANGNGW